MTINNYTLYVLNPSLIDVDVDYLDVSLDTIREHSVEFYQSKSLNQIIRLLYQFNNNDLFVASDNHYYVVDNQTNEVVR